MDQKSCRGKLTPIFYPVSCRFTVHFHILSYLILETVLLKPLSYVSLTNKDYGREPLFIEKADCAASGALRQEENEHTVGQKGPGWLSPNFWMRSVLTEQPLHGRGQKQTRVADLLLAFSVMLSVKFFECTNANSFYLILTADKKGWWGLLCSAPSSHGSALRAVTALSSSKPWLLGEGSICYPIWWQFQQRDWNLTPAKKVREKICRKD